MVRVTNNNTFGWTIKITLLLAVAVACLGVVSRVAAAGKDRTNNDIRSKDIVAIDNFEEYRVIAKKCRLNMLYGETKQQAELALDRKHSKWAWMLWAYAYSQMPTPAPGYEVEGGRPLADFEKIVKAFDDKSWGNDVDVLLVLSDLRSVDPVQLSSILVEEWKPFKLQDKNGKYIRTEMAPIVRQKPNAKYIKYMKEPVLKAAKLAPRNFRVRFRLAMLDLDMRGSYKKMLAICEESEKNVDENVCLNMYQRARAAGLQPDARTWKSRFIEKAKSIEGTAWRKYIKATMGF